MTIAENSFWQLVDQGLGRGLLFLFYAFIPLAIGPEAYGSFAVAQAAMLVVAEPLMSLGLDSIVVRNVARGRLAVLCPAFFLRGALIAAAGVASVAVGTALGGDTRVVSLLWAYLATLSMERLLFSYYRGREWMRMEGIAGALQKSLALPILACLAALGVRGAVLPALSLALMAVIGAALLARLYRREIAELVRLAAQSTETVDLAALLREGAVLGLATAAAVVYFRVDSVMLGILADDAAAGMYSAAYRFMEATFVLPALLMAAVFPRLARADSGSAALRGSAVGLAAIGIGATAAVYAGAEPLIAGLYGPAYARAGRTLEILAFAITPVYLGVVLTQAMIARGRQAAYLRLSVLGLAINVTLNLLLIPAYLEIGAAVATLVTEIVVAVGAAISLRRES